MALADLSGDSLTLFRSESESSRFELSVFRMTVPDSVEDIDLLRAAVADADADVIIVRYRSSATAVPRLLASLGRPLIHTPALGYWEASPSRHVAQQLPEGLGVQNDLTDPAACALAVARIGDIFAGYVNHYSYNPLFSAERSLAGYQEWAERTIRDSPTDSSVLLYGGEIIGVATMIRKPSVNPCHGEETEVALAGLVPDARGRGWYEHLLGSCVERTEQIGASRLVISTQVTNAGVQRAWARMGLLPFGSVETAHLLRPGLL